MSQPPSIVQLAPGVQIPQTVQYSIGIDHQLRKTLTLSVTYTGARGYHLFRSRDINAPPPPLYRDASQIRRMAPCARSSPTAGSRPGRCR